MHVSSKLSALELFVHFWQKKSFFHLNIAEVPDMVHNAVLHFFFVYDSLAKHLSLLSFNCVNCFFQNGLVCCWKHNCNQSINSHSISDDEAIKIIPAHFFWKPLLSCVKHCISSFRKDSKDSNHFQSWIMLINPGVQNFWWEVMMKSQRALKEKSFVKEKLFCI